MIEAFSKTITALTEPGGLIRVRAVLAMGMTVIGGVYLLHQTEMPPGEFNILWSAATAYYFGTRGGNDTGERNAQ